MSSIETAMPLGALDDTPFADWTPSRLAGDASSRRYWRLRDQTGRSVILMDNGAPDGNGFPAFVSMSEHLADLGLVAPQILHLEPERRFAILTDLGPTTLAEHIRERPDDEPTLLADLVGLLPLLCSKPPPPDLIHLTPEIATAMIAPLFETAGQEVPSRLRKDIETRMTEALHSLCGPPTVLSLRDFHAENVIWRAAGSGTDRFGLLDFQDAFVAPPEYDLASLLRDVRRDVGQDARARGLARFSELTGKSHDSVSAACAILGLQRNLRIMGVFGRLAREMGKSRYLEFLPRTARLVREDASHPALAPLATPIERLLSHMTT